MSTFLIIYVYPLSSDFVVVSQAFLLIFVIVLWLRIFPHSCLIFSVKLLLTELDSKCIVFFCNWIFFFSFTCFYTNSSTQSAIVSYYSMYLIEAVVILSSSWIKPLSLFSQLMVWFADVCCVGWGLSEALVVRTAWRLPYDWIRESRTSTTALQLEAAYSSSTCVLYGHICIARVCGCKYTFSQNSGATSSRLPELYFSHAIHWCGEILYQFFGDGLCSTLFFTTFELIIYIYIYIYILANEQFVMLKLTTSLVVLQDR